MILSLQKMWKKNKMFEITDNSLLSSSLKTDDYKMLLKIKSNKNK